MALCAGALAQEHGAADEHGHESGHEVVLAVGLVHEGRDNDIAAGFEYGYRFNERWGAGVIVERLWGNQTSTIWALPVVRHFGGWEALVAPGVERRSSGSKEMLRIGVARRYATDLGPIVPVAALDFLDGETILVLSVGLVFEL